MQVIQSQALATRKVASKHVITHSRPSGSVMLHRKRDIASSFHLHRSLTWCLAV
jgi:hypothetical protein